MSNYIYCVCNEFGDTLREYSTEEDASEGCDYGNDEFISRQLEEGDDERIDVIGQNGNDGLHYKENEVSEDENKFNIEVTDNDDGSANVTMDLDNETQTMLMKQGLQYLIDEMKMTDKVMVLSPNEFDGEASTWELSDDDRNALFHFGFINALKIGMEKDD
jgi:hypothetical protein